MSSFKSTLKYGVPFLSFVVLGSFLLREFASIRYEIYSYKRRYGQIGSKDNFGQLDNDVQDNLREEDIKALEQLGANDKWENIRGPRPWEDNRQYTSLVESLKEKAKK